MEKEFIPYELAVKLKKLVFDEPCLACYTENAIGKGDKLQYFVIPIACNDDYVFVAAPLYQQAFRWFREKYVLYPHIFSKEDGAFVWCIRWYLDGLQKDIPYESSKTYEEAELACLTKLIEIVESKSE